MTVKSLTAIATLLLSSVAFAGNYADKANHSESSDATIVDIAVGAGNFQTLVTALKAADLVGTLQGEGPFTVFAPTDEAFAALPEGALENLLDNPAELTKVLTLHVVAGRAGAADVVKLDRVTSLQGSDLDVDTSAGVTIAGANVVKADINAVNGIVHVIDKVILPQS